MTSLRAHTNNRCKSKSSFLLFPLNGLCPGLYNLTNYWSRYALSDVMLGRNPDNSSVTDEISVVRKRFLRLLVLSGSFLPLTHLPNRITKLSDACLTQRYSSVGTPKRTTPFSNYSPSAPLKDLVRTVAPITYFSSPRMQKTPRMRHGVTEVEALRGLKSRQIINGGIITLLFVLTLYPRPADLPSFMEQYRLDTVDATYSVVQINGGAYSTDDPSFAGDVDMEYSLAQFCTPSMA